MNVLSYQFRNSLQIYLLISCSFINDNAWVSFFETLFQQMFDLHYRKDIAILSALTTLQKVIGSLSKFMSPYIVEILQVLTCHRFNADITGKASSCDSQIKIKALSLSETISKNIIPRVLLPMLDSAFDYVVQSEKVKYFPFIKQLVLILKKVKLVIGVTDFSKSFKYS